MVTAASSHLAMTLRLFAVMALCSLGATKSAHEQSGGSGCSGVSASTSGSVTWTPVWCQEFNGPAGPPDTTAWAFELGSHNGWGNHELQIYCGPPGYPNNLPECPTTFSAKTNTTYLDGRGHLVIRPFTNKGKWISARMKTQGMKDFQYGRIEARIQLPDTTKQGLWPAFWSLGSNITSTPWPMCGEADIMENWSPSILNGPGTNGNRATIHTALTGHAGKGAAYTFPPGQQGNTGFHVYGVIWSANLMQYYVDDPSKPFFVVTPSNLAADDSWPFNASMFLLANVAVGGALGGSTAKLADPQPMLIDYVRQYTASAVSAPALGAPPAIAVKAGATSGNTSTFAPTLTPGTGYVYFRCSTNAPKASCSLKTTDKLNSFVISSANPEESVTVTVATTANGVGEGGTPPGSYSVTVTAWTESNTTGNADATVQIPLTVG
jgi:beta-glucanase (GH16 family)